MKLCACADFKKLEGTMIKGIARNIFRHISKFSCVSGGIFHSRNTRRIYYSRSEVQPEKIFGGFQSCGVCIKFGHGFLQFQSFITTRHSFQGFEPVTSPPQIRPCQNNDDQLMEFVNLSIFHTLGKSGFGHLGRLRVCSGAQSPTLK